MSKRVKQTFKVYSSLFKEVETIRVRLTENVRLLLGSPKIEVLVGFAIGKITIRSDKPRTEVKRILEKLLNKNITYKVWLV